MSNRKAERETARATKAVVKRIQPFIQSAIQRVFTAPTGKNSSTYLEDYIGKFLQSALSDVNSRSGQLLANIIFTPDIVQKIDFDNQVSTERDKGFANYLLYNTLYDRQQEVYSALQSGLYRNILIINSRRSGKTELMGRLIVSDLINTPDAHVVYINRNSSAAIRQIKKPLDTALNCQSAVRVVKGSVESQYLQFDNGSQLLIVGNNNSADIDKLRGERISLCIMDECGHQRNTRTLIREVIKPALMDYGNSKLIMVGTPPRIPHTYVEECYNNTNWKKYSWTFQDNPFIPNKENVIKEVCEENGVDENSAFIQREYFGRMDAYDDDAKVWKKYSIASEVQVRNTTTVWDYCWIGIDWGYEDLGAIITVLADKKSKRAFVVNSWSKAHTGVEEKAKEIQRQIDWVKENYVLARPPMIICDTNNKEAIADLTTVHHLKNVYGAYKYDRDNAIDNLADYLASNRICLLENRSDSLVTDCENTLWKRDEETDKILHEIDDDIWHPNAMMALLYVSRQFAYDVLGRIDDNKPARMIAVTEDLLDEDGHVRAGDVGWLMNKQKTRYDDPE